MRIRHVGTRGAVIAIGAPTDRLAARVARAVTERTELTPVAGAREVDARCDIEQDDSGLVAVLRHRHGPGRVWSTVRRLPPAQSEVQLVEYVVGSLHFLAAIASTYDTFVHAGVVEVAGTMVLLPGMSRSGKSTLVAALVEDGATYWSDEYAIIDRSGQVFPYRKPLSERGNGARPGLIDLAGPVAAAVPSAAPCLVLDLTFDPEADADWVPMGGAEIVFSLLGHSVTARARPDADVDAIVEVAARSRGLRGTRGDATDAVALIRRLVETPPGLGSSDPAAVTRR